MKYLNNRNDFLKNIKINEAFEMGGSGPLGNDINWGDSLVGRLINSIRRKIGIEASMVRIDSCINSLKSSFDDIINQSSFLNLEEEKQKNYNKIILFEYIRIIEVAIFEKRQIGFTGEDENNNSTQIKDDEYLREIKSITIGVIEGIGEINPENEDKIISYLNQLLKKINEMERELSQNQRQVDQKPIGQVDQKAIGQVDQKAIGQVDQKAIGQVDQKAIGQGDQKAIGQGDQKAIGQGDQKAIRQTHQQKALEMGKKNQQEKLKETLKLREDQLKTREEELKNETDPTKRKNLEEDIDRLKNELEANKRSIKESIINSYYEFISIKEDVDNKENITKEDENDQSILKEFWINLMKKGLGKYILTRKEVEKLKIEIDKIEINTNEDSIVIKGGASGIDPIIEVVKIFNRAYKLHTTQVILSGRSGGKVSNAVFRQYTCFGNGTPENAGSGGGPYRNNKLFNKWENAVLDILKDRKYQPIFSKNTLIMVGDEKRKDIGPIFNKFILDILDGEDLYQSKGYSGKEGAQKAFLSKYFNSYVVGEINKTGFGNDVEVVNKISNSIKNINLTLESLKDINSINKSGKVFLVKGQIKDSDGKSQDIKIYFNIKESKESTKLIICSKYNTTFKSIIDNKYEKYNIVYDTSFKSTEYKQVLLSKYIQSNESEIINKLSKKESLDLSFFDVYENKKVSFTFTPSGEIKWVFIKKEDSDKKELLELKNDDYPKNLNLTITDNIPSIT